MQRLGEKREKMQVNKQQYQQEKIIKEVDCWECEQQKQEKTEKNTFLHTLHKCMHLLMQSG